MLIDCAALERE